jgi:excisionase family DNA binding protein
MQTTQELLKPFELAERLKVSRATITKWRRSGRIPTIKINATVYRFDYAEVVAALRRNGGTA